MTKTFIRTFMMKACVRACAALLAFGVAAAPVRAQGTAPMSPDSVMPIVRRAQQLISSGNGGEGRALLDSLLQKLESGPQNDAAEAEALFWRATLAASWDDAQRDYLRVMLEHDRSPRAADAMLRLAQGEITRGDRDAALRFLERLAREAPDASARAEASLWHGRLLIERGQRDDGCQMLRSGRARVSDAALELQNQYAYVLQTCPAALAVAPRQDSAPTPSPPTTPPTTPATTPATTPSTAPATGTAWSVQVGAFRTKAEADAFANEVRTLGWEARVDGTAAPFRVRFGFYATREEAMREQNAYKARARADAFLTQVTR